jgi:hypothetical protein
VLVLRNLSACPVVVCAAFIVLLFSRAVRLGIGSPLAFLPTVVGVLDDLSTRVFQTSFGHSFPAESPGAWLFSRSSSFWSAADLT